MRNSRYKLWYENSLAALRNELRKIGVDTFIIPSNEVVNKTLLMSFDHTASKSVLDYYYDGFASKRGFESVEMTLEKPEINKKITGNFWVSKI